jgi:hypothetical protein
MAHAIQTVHIQCCDSWTAEEVTAELRDALRACAAEEAFVTAFTEIRSATDREVDHALTLMPMLTRMAASSKRESEIFLHILDRFFGESDKSTFGLMNAVTSVARDTDDPDLRWRLEELGGGIPVGRIPPPSIDDAAGEVMEYPDQTTLRASSRIKAEERHLQLV